MRCWRSASMLVGFLVLTGCAGGQPTLVINTAPPIAASLQPTPVPSLVAVQVPTPTPKPTATPKPTPKPPYPDQWLWYACKVLTDLGSGAGHVDAAGHYVVAGDWGMVRVEAGGADDESLNILQLASEAPRWSPASGFINAAKTASASVWGAGRDWNLAATFQTLDTATEAAAKSSRAVADVQKAVDLFSALSKKYHFDCRT